MAHVQTEVTEVTPENYESGRVWHSHIHTTTGGYRTERWRTRQNGLGRTTNVDLWCAQKGWLEVGQFRCLDPICAVEEAAEALWAGP